MKLFFFSVSLVCLTPRDPSVSPSFRSLVRDFLSCGKDPDKHRLWGKQLQGQWKYLPNAVCQILWQNICQIL